MKLDAMIDKLHDPASGKRRPRTYRKVLRKKYLAHAKSKKRTTKQTRSIIRIMLCAVKRNMDFAEGFLGNGGFLGERDIELLATIRKLYAQQKEMFDEKKHRVAERIVSITQPYIRPIVRGKVKSPVEFGAKYDVSIALSVLVANLFGVQLSPLFLFYFMDASDGKMACHMLEIKDEAA